jgi:hypothetical protein
LNDRERFEFYEKLYFHELEAREQMHTRVQIPITLITATIGALGFMGQNIDRDLSSLWVTSFYILFFIAAIFIITSGYFCGRSAWGYFYSKTALAKTWDDYHRECVVTYEGEPVADQENLVHSAIKNSVQERYIECATTNSEINEKRSYYYSNTIYWLFFAIGATSLAFIFYFLGSLDKSLHSKPSEIKIVSSIPLKGETMNQPSVTSPPPAPPAPPVRVVRDAPITHKQPPPPPPQHGH